MAVIENFAELSQMELREFAEALIKTINSESIFTDQTDFKITNVEPYDHTGELLIEVEHTHPIEVSRHASWAANDSDDADNLRDTSIEFDNNASEDIENTFKATSVTIDGYVVTLNVADFNQTNTDARVEKIDSITDDDAGIGWYEYGDGTFYDSQPFVQVEGTIIEEYDCYIGFFVDLDLAPAEEEPEQLEAEEAETVEPEAEEPEEN